MISWFRFSQAGDRVFGCSETLAIWKLAGWQGAVGARLGLGPAVTVHDIVLPDDVAQVLVNLPDPD